MPNYCEYNMIIKGSKKAINRIIECLEADYNYGAGKPDHLHFFRVFDVFYEKEDIINLGNGKYSLFIWGNCAWSVYSCMCDGEHTYYNDVKKFHKDIFMGTTLQEQSKDCEIEVFSEEPGMGFSEHYIYKNGECLCDETCEIEQGGYDEQGNPTTDIDWDEYNGEIVMFNPFREGADEDFRWTI